DTAAYMDKAFKLYATIDLSGVTFNMIGSPGNPFTGVFKGNYQTISNLDIASTVTPTGLFRYISGGTVEHLFLTIGNVAACGTCSAVGAVAGTITNWAVIDDVHVDGTGTSTVVGQHSVGGIIGNATAPCAIIANSSVDDLIVSGAGSYVGGIAGYGPIRISRSNVASTVAVSGSILYTGGVIGRSLEDISETYSLAEVSGPNYVGGFVGYLESGTVSNCYAKGSVTSNGGSEVGGFGGHLDAGTTVEFSYAIGKVAGTSGTMGCFAGWSGATDTANFWINNGDGVTTCNLGASALGNGATSLAMRTTDAGGTAGLIDLYESVWSTTDWYYNVGGYPYLMNNQED
ncbi:MAG: GLUG motif-containing protein, partial [Bdellovibrionota bacterium]